VNDWKGIARASGLNGSADELESLTAPLQGLEQILRPLLRELRPDLDPATGFDAGEDEAE
jgi:hypothetical protein